MPSIGLVITEIDLENLRILKLKKDISTNVPHTIFILSIMRISLMITELSSQRPHANG